MLALICSVCEKDSYLTLFLFNVGLTFFWFNLKAQTATTFLIPNDFVYFIYGIKIISFQILGIFLTCWLANTLENDDDEVIKIHNGHHEHRAYSETQSHSSETPI